MYLFACTDDLPSYQIVLLSDGKPSDMEPLQIGLQQSILTALASTLGENLSFFAIGLGKSGNDFEALERLAKTAQDAGSTGTYTYSDLSCLKLGEAFSSVAMSMTASRTEKLAANGNKEPRKEKDVKLRGRFVPKSQRTFQRHTGQVSRWKYDHSKYKSRQEWPWTKVEFKNAAVVGFDIERNPFGKGAERLAYMFHEIGRDYRRKGKPMVAKETGHSNNEDRKVKFHETFCRAQRKAEDLAKEFNKAVKRSPRLRPTESVLKTPDIHFLDCFVYEYSAADGTGCGLLVEDYLTGKFTKYNGNNGFVRKTSSDDRTIDLAVGKVYISDFVQAFSHWVFVQTDHQLLVCDLQGVLNEEGRHPKFELTDPCICTKRRKGRRRYGITNIGFNGIKQFRMHHECNGVCEGLGLPAFRIRRSK